MLQLQKIHLPKTSFLIVKDPNKQFLNHILIINNGVLNEHEIKLKLDVLVLVLLIHSHAFTYSPYYAKCYCEYK